MTPQAKEYYREKLMALPDAESRSFERPEIKDISHVKSVHIIGVCGTAMGSLAGLLSQAGYTVSGSDTGCYPPMSDLIKELGITFFEGFHADNLKDKDLIVVGNACGPTNPEAQFARENNLPHVSLGEALNLFFLNHKKSLVVAGTHGKTTTTGLLAHVLLAAGRDPGFLVGGVVQKTGKSFGVGEGNHFVIEGDEYDTAYFDKAPKFLHYKPWGGIITSLEFDHIDIYKDMKEYTQAFKFFAQEIDPKGILMVWGDMQLVRDLGSSTYARLYTYGLDRDNDVTAKNIVVTEAGQKFTLSIAKKEKGEITLPLPGEHNLLNTLAVCGLLNYCGLSFAQIKSGIESFGGMKRRQEVVGEEKGITIIDDFAHHPTAVRETIKAIKQKYAGRKVIAIFEPRSNTSRRKTFEEDYINSFDDADALYLKVPPLRHNDNPDDFMDSKKVVEEVTKRGTLAFLYDTADAIVSDLTPILKEGDVLLVMSNGSFDGIHQKLLQAIKEK